MVSVVIRETLLQLWTPDEVRGRVNAVNSVFVSASNELGEFRAGTMAHVIGVGAVGAVPAVVIGGAGAIAVAGAWAATATPLLLLGGVSLAGAAMQALQAIRWFYHYPADWHYPVLTAMVASSCNARLTQWLATTRPL